MAVSPQDTPLMAMDLSTGFSVKPLPRDHGEALDLAKKPEWFHRRPPPGCGAADLGSPYRPRDASSYGARRPRPEPGEAEPGPESLGNRYMNSTLAPGLDLCRDGVHGGLWHPGFYGPDPTGGEAPESSSGGSGAGGEESDSGSDVIFLVSSTAEPARCGSFLQDGVRRGVEEEEEEEEKEGGRGLPRPPSPDSLSADASEGAADIPVRHARPVVLLSDLAAVYANAAASPVNISSDDDDDDSDVVEVSPPPPPRRRSPVRETPPPSDGDKRLRRREVRRSNRIRRPASDKPPASCGGGGGGGAKASRHSLRRRAKSDAVGIYNESGDSDAVMDFAVTLCGSDEDEEEEEKDEEEEEAEEEEAASRPDENERVGGNSEESDAGEESPQRKSPERRPPRGKVPDASGAARKRAAPGGPREAASARTKRRRSAGAKAPKPRDTKTNKKPVARRRRRGGGGGGGRQQGGPSAMFGPREPEITLKYANAAKRRSKKAAAFCPFVHAKETACTVVNDQEEEEAVRSGRRRPGAGAGPPSGFVPGTTCYRLCRYAADGERPAPPLCCLCGQTANAAGLGDLHGPYRPADPAPPTVSRRSVNASEDGDGSDGGAGSGVSLPAPGRLDEGWIHEDCGVWSAGVFLVRGKLYGMEEAARIAQETKCSLCQQTGAIMGCFQKACPRNYHYRCAIQSGCVLNEENFSIRCPEHKNKLLTVVTRQHKR